VNTERVDRRQETIQFVRETVTGWRDPDEVLDLGEVSWLPDLETADGQLMHLALEEIDTAWARRLRAAKGEGRRITVACTPEALRIENLALLQEIDARILLLLDEGEEMEARQYGSVADMVALYDLDLGDGGLRQLAEPLFDRALASTNRYLKGLYFEQVLCLLFSQVGYFHVMSHRYVNETEEIDLVLGNRAAGPLAGIIAGPIVLASGKNQRKSAGAPEVRELRGNMNNRRRRCNFGILASATGVADTAFTEQIRATDDPAKAVAILTGSMIRRLIASNQLERDLQDELVKAVMD
jgi:hypothetical protein